MGELLQLNWGRATPPRACLRRIQTRKRPQSAEPSPGGAASPPLLEPLLEPLPELDPELEPEPDPELEPEPELLPEEELLAESVPPSPGAFWLTHTLNCGPLGEPR